MVKQVRSGDHSRPKFHQHGEHGEHAHDIIWEDSKVVGRPERELTERERKEHGDML